MNNQYLKNIALEKYLSQREIKMLFSHNKITPFFQGDFILKQGKYSNGIYIILDGSVNVIAKILGQGINHIETLGPGNFLGEISFIENVPCATSVVANEKVTCLFISYHYFELLTTFFPETKFKIYHAIVGQVGERLEKMYNKITKFMTHADMTTQSLFKEVFQMLTKLEKMTVDECKINRNQLKNILFNFNEDEINELLDHSSLLKAEKNCILIGEKQKKSACYIVIQGAVQSSIIYDNKIAKLSVIGPHTLFASVATFLQNTNFTITFTACENVIALSLSEGDLKFIKKENRPFWYKLFYLICRSFVVLERSVDKLDIRLKIEEYNR